MNNWISVKDKLPTESGRYLTCLEFGNKLSVVFNNFAVNLADIHDSLENKNYSGWYDYDNYDGIEYCEEIKNITHWMPIPEPPR